MFLNNTLTGTGGNSVDLYGMSTNQSCAVDIVNSGNGPVNYDPEVNNTYFFNNTKNGSNVTATLTGVPPDNCTVSANVNWWNQPASFNGTVGVGGGPIASRPATCSTGVGYWVTNEGSWNTKLAANTSGRFYRCTSTNTWTLYYTPYTYPHPLRSSSSSTALLPPSNVSAVVQ